MSDANTRNRYLDTLFASVPTDRVAAFCAAPPGLAEQARTLNDIPPHF
jgi:hypothetical protein